MSTPKPLSGLQRKAYYEKLFTLKSKLGGADLAEETIPVLAFAVGSVTIRATQVSCVTIIESSNYRKSFDHAASVEYLEERVRRAQYMADNPESNTYI